MKTTYIKIPVFILVFLVSLVVIGKFMNKGHDNITMEMAQATFPVITMERGGVAYNMLHGYREAMDTAFQRDAITVLGENRETDFTIDTFGRNVTGISMEVRSIDGTRLIEDTKITEQRAYEGKIHARIALKDLIEKDTEYMLILLLEMDEEEEIYYYTRVIWGDDLYADEKLAFVMDFHERLYDREQARELTKYLESNSSLQDNKSFHYVNIHSSFKQITWGNLQVEELGAPSLRLSEIASQTASILMDYMVAVPGGREQVYYQVEEYYRIRYTAERTYLLDYERTMTQIPDVQRMYGNDKILLGITGTDIPMMESGDGNVVAFEVANQLLGYNVTANKLAVIFSFYNSENADSRTLFPEHTIKILEVDEGGNVQFAVYGYMNRGRHEGEVGIQLYAYDSELNTIEEIIYIPYNKSYTVLDAQMRQLLYLSKGQKLYLLLENEIYGIDLAEKSYDIMAVLDQDDTIQVSDNHRILVSRLSSGDQNSDYCTRLSVRNLNNETEKIISVGADEAVRPMGFMGEDIIYGVARKGDIVEESSGRIFFPMYKVCISNSDGELLKEYEQPGIYITGCRVENNQITLERQQRLESGAYIDVEEDHIMNNSEEDMGQNVIVAANIDVYERYVQIQTKNIIDSKSIKVLTPKEVVFEGGRELRFAEERESSEYYVYGPYGVSGIYHAPAAAVNQAYEISGVVVNGNGDYVWKKGTRASRNQIMAIKEESATENRDSLAVCLNTMLKYEGIIRNAEYLLGQGQTVREILESNLEDARILDLTGCGLDAVLYYVNQDIPVLALLKNGEAVLVVGFNEYNVGIMEPATGRLYQKGMNDAAEWFAENGNSFITYIRVQ